MMFSSLLFLPLLLLLGKTQVTAAAEISSNGANQYSPSEQVQVWGKYIGPYSNPHEIYSFEELPTCELWKAILERKTPQEGGGAALVSSPRIQILFPGTATNLTNDPLSRDVKEICRMKMTSAVSTKLTEMILADYSVAYVIDDLTVVAQLGQSHQQSQHEANKQPNNKTSAQPEIFSHKSFFLQKNGNYIVGAELVQSAPIPIVLDEVIRFTYEVVWVDSLAPVESRRKFAEASPVESRIQLVSTLNGMTAACFMVGLTIIIHRRTAKEFSSKRPAGTNGGDIDLPEKLDINGWSLICNDVFRKPKRLALYSLITGSGLHLSIVILMSLLLLNPSKPWTPLSLMGMYALTQPIQTWRTLRTYSSYGGLYWKQIAAWDVILVPIVVAVIFLQVNTVAMAQMTSLSIPTEKVTQMLFFFMLVNIPVAVITTYIFYKRRLSLAAQQRGMKYFPCRVLKLQRPIPESSFRLLKLFMMVALMGAITFGTLAIDFHYIYASLWTQRNFVTASHLIVQIIFAAIVLSCGSILLLHYLVETENYLWHWPAGIYCGAALGIYVLLYCVFYLHSGATAIHGLLQQVFYWAISSAIAIFSGMAGAGITELTTSTYMNYIYSML